MTTDVENQVWSVLRANIGLLEDSNEVFVISRFVKPSNTQVKGIMYRENAVGDRVCAFRGLTRASVCLKGKLLIQVKESLTERFKRSKTWKQ